MAQNDWGTVNSTTAGEVGAAGKPIRIKMLHFISDGTAGVTSLKNNGTSGTIHVTETGTINTGKTFFYGEDGLLFPLGCWVANDSHATNYTVVCKKVL
jgi:hypothetical protein